MTRVTLPSGYTIIITGDGTVSAPSPHEAEAEARRLAQGRVPCWSPFGTLFAGRALAWTH